MLGEHSTVKEIIDHRGGATPRSGGEKTVTGRTHCLKGVLQGI